MHKTYLVHGRSSIMACTHDASAHTSYLFIVKDR